MCQVLRSVPRSVRELEVIDSSGTVLEDPTGPPAFELPNLKRLNYWAQDIHPFNYVLTHLVAGAGVLDHLSLRLDDDDSQFGIFWVLLNREIMPQIKAWRGTGILIMLAMCPEYFRPERITCDGALDESTYSTIAALDSVKFLEIGELSSSALFRSGVPQGLQELVVERMVLSGPGDPREIVNRADRGLRISVGSFGMPSLEDLGVAGMRALIAEVAMWQLVIGVGGVREPDLEEFLEAAVQLGPNKDSMPRA